MPKRIFPISPGGRFRISRKGGRGKMGGFGLGLGGECVCPNCGTKVSHQRGIPL